ncbi:MAG: HD domain-containing protein [Lachnospiraceae bacterium]|nr:HD domain-containing protein [Lachnospiraceae bacterium]
MVTIYYLLVTVIAFYVMLKFFLQNQKVDSRYAMLSFLIMVNCLGRFSLAISQTEEMALYSTKLMYIGSTYALLVTLSVVERLCQFKISKIVKASLLVFSSTIIGLVLTVEKHDLYYKSVRLVKANGYNYLEKEYGPCHMLNPMWSIFITVLMLGTLIYAYRNNKSISYRLVRVIGILVSIPMIAYIAEKIFRPSVSFVVIGYLIIIIQLNRLYTRVYTYDITANIIYSIERMKEYGYMLFDEKDRYVGANEYAKELFPEICIWAIDETPKNRDTYLYREVVEYCLNYKGDKFEPKTIEVGENYFEVQCTELLGKRNKSLGHVLEFVNRTAEKKYLNAMMDYSIMLEQEVTEKTEDILHVKDMLVLGMADLLENRDVSTGGHIKRTSSIVKIFGKKLIEHAEDFGITELFLKRVEKAAPMHDIGKIAIDDKVLRKQGKYTDEEFEIMKRHTVEGGRIIEQIMKDVEDEKVYKIIRNVAAYHHEKWNGTGYPEGLKGTDIPLEARIMALADVFDALVSKRCYKDAFSYDKAFNIIEESLGQHFDPDLGKLFLECRPELEELYDKQ